VTNVVAVVRAPWCRLATALVMSLGAAASAQETPAVDDGSAADVATVVTSAPPTQVELSVATEAWHGDTTYRIGGAVRLPDGRQLRTRFPISELEFPMDVTVGALAVKVPVGAQWEVGARGAKNLTTDAGTVTDADWGALTGGDTVDIYSESDADLDVWEAEAWCRYALPPVAGVRFSLGLGYLRQELSYDVSNLNQSYPSSGGALAPDIVAGRVATYDATFSLPYAEARASAELGPRVGLTFRAAAAPLATVEDEDHHLLRDKVSKADDDGFGVMLDGACRYRAISGLFLEAGVSYRSIDADGRQTQTDAGGTIGSVAHEVEQRLTIARLALGWAL
jgi:outer membrane protease